MSDAEKQASEPVDEERLDADVEETEGALAAANSNLLREQYEVTSVFLLASLIALAFLVLFARGRKCRNGALDKQGISNVLEYHAGRGQQSTHRNVVPQDIFFSTFLRIAPASDVFAPKIASRKWFFSSPTILSFSTIMKT